MPIPVSRTVSLTSRRTIPEVVLTVAGSAETAPRSSRVILTSPFCVNFKAFPTMLKRTLLRESSARHLVAGEPQDSPLEATDVDQRPPPVAPLLDLEQQVHLALRRRRRALLTLRQVLAHEINPLLPHPRTLRDSLDQRCQIYLHERAAVHLCDVTWRRDGRGVVEFREVEDVVEYVRKRLEADVGGVQQRGELAKLERRSKLFTNELIETNADER